MHFLTTGQSAIYAYRESRNLYTGGDTDKVFEREVLCLISFTSNVLNHQNILELNPLSDP